MINRIQRSHSRVFGSGGGRGPIALFEFVPREGGGIVLRIDQVVHDGALLPEPEAATGYEMTVICINTGALMRVAFRDIPAHLIGVGQSLE